MRATRALIHLSHLAHNVAVIRRLVGPERKICLPVKANAYGHGAVVIARAAVAAGVDCLAVATVSEGQQLRDAGVDAPVLLLNHALPEELPGLLAARLVPVAGSSGYLDRLAALVSDGSPPLEVHLKVDTGMGRIGCTPEEAPALARRIAVDSRFRLGGLCTHFPSADSLDPDDLHFTRKQTEAFGALVATLKGEGIDPGIVHAANSGGVATLRDSWFDMVRPGLALYGYEPVPERPLGLKPVMEFQTRVTFLKTVAEGTSVSYGRTWKASGTTVIATIPVGYGDGYNRLLSGRGRVLIKGRLYPVVGRVCMDMCMVDLGPDSGVELHDTAVLFGPDPAGWSAADMARELDTIPYEVTCWISPRVPRQIIENATEPKG